MRLHAFLLVAVAALQVRAATIPVSETEKKLTDIVPENLEKIPENTSSEQELIDQANTIKDVENKLRVKPEDIPVEVIVEDAQPGLKADSKNNDSEEINRPAPDLSNPGLPQRQEHETQNPEYNVSEQQTILNFKKSLLEAQNTLKQGFQGITDSVQNMIENNVQFAVIQKSIQSLREGFNAQINKLNGTIQTFLNTDSSSTNEPAVEQTKSSIYKIEEGLITLRNDFNKGVKVLSDGAEIVAILKAENENSNPNSGSTGSTSGSTGSTSGSTGSTSGSTAAPGNPWLIAFSGYMQNLQQQFQAYMQTLSTMATQPGFGLNQQSAVPTAVQSDSQVPSATTAAPANFWQGLQNSFNAIVNPNQGQVQSDEPATQRPPGPIAQVINSITSYLTPKPAGQTPQGAQPAPAVQPAPTVQPAETEPKPSQNAVKPDVQSEPAKPADTTQATAVTAAGPIRQILQNNPISQGIAGAVQSLQNLNNPEKPRVTEKVEEQKSEKANKQDEVQSEEEFKGHYGGGQNSGDNNDSNDSRLAEKEVVKADEKLPEAQKEDDIKEHKTDEVADKTE